MANKTKTAPNMADLTKTTKGKKMTDSKTSTKKASKKKAPDKKSKAKTSTKATTDFLLAQTHEVENLTEEKALKWAEELLESEGVNDFQLGGVLQKIQEEKWWKEAESESFKEYIELRLGFAYRKSMTLINIYEVLTACGISWDQVKSIGWSKIRFILPVLNEENVEEWVERCATMNALEIQAYVKELRAAQSSNGADPASSAAAATGISALTFKVHDDQKEIINDAVGRMKEELDTDFASVAIENICLRYLDGTLGKKKAAKVDKKSVKKYLEELGADTAAELVIEVHPSLGDDDDE